MIYAGCDLGIVSAKAVIIDNTDILALEILPFKSFPRQAATEVMGRAMAGAGIAETDIDYCLSTGVGAKGVSRARAIVPEEVCLQRAVSELNPRARTVVHAGGHSLLAFNMTGDGELLECAVVDMCAAGTGIFIDSIARALETPLSELIRASLGIANPPPLSSQCVVFAESEAISMINEGHDVSDIFAGVVSSSAIRIASVVRRVDVVEEVVMTGGVAKNDAVVSMLQERLGLRFAGLGGVDPQAVGSLGAAFLAREGWTP